ncbi:hypothetical protein D5S17_18765 [Pseudonocardiaceae bacterium YIM PH 21723]|nr:hypothetical protein D5S17_18765 [Pseudonocardiaceae bacterium YIM PH 21723]
MRPPTTDPPQAHPPSGTITVSRVDWNTPVDIYCERLTAGPWSEPLNAISNLSFFAAAVFAWLLIRHRQAPASIKWVIILLALVGVGSSAFHIYAEVWGSALDTGFIALWVLWYTCVYARFFWRLSWRFAWLGAPAIIVFAVLVQFTLTPILPEGVRLYAAPALALLGITVALSARDELSRYIPGFATATALFWLSLTFRSIDGPACHSVPIGTHFLWHILNGIVLYLLTRTLITRWRDCAESFTS